MLLHRCGRGGAGRPDQIATEGSKNEDGDKGDQ